MTAEPAKAPTDLNESARVVWETGWDLGYAAGVQAGRREAARGIRHAADEQGEIMARRSDFDDGREMAVRQRAFREAARIAEGAAGD